MPGLVPEHEPQGLHGAFVHANHRGIGSHHISYGCSVRRLVERDHPPVRPQAEHQRKRKWRRFMFKMNMLYFLLCVDYG